MEGENHRNQMTMLPARGPGGNKRQAANHDENLSESADLHVPNVKRAKKSTAHKATRILETGSISNQLEPPAQKFLFHYAEKPDSRAVLAYLSRSLQSFILNPLVEKLIVDLGDASNDRKDTDEEAVGRAVRLSLPLRICLSATLEHCVSIKELQVSTGADLIWVIQKCQKILQIASRGSNMKRTFAFQKLPTEVRIMLYRLVFGRELSILVDTCAVHKQDRTKMGLPSSGFQNILLTCKQIYAEALPLYYEFNTFEFSCTGALSSFLKHCPQGALDNITMIDFTWKGSNADDGIGRLSNLKKLKTLSVTVDAETTTRPSKHEEDLRKYFQAAARKMIRLVESLGFEELIRLRGLDSVMVHTTAACRKYYRKHDEADDLRKFLQIKLLLPRTPENDL